VGRHPPVSVTFSIGIVGITYMVQLGMDSTGHKTLLWKLLEELSLDSFMCLDHLAFYRMGRRQILRNIIMTNSVGSS
jgi:hypothetical protein